MEKLPKTSTSQNLAFENWNLELGAVDFKVPSAVYAKAGRYIILNNKTLEEYEDRYDRLNARLEGIIKQNLALLLKNSRYFSEKFILDFDGSMHYNGKRNYIGFEITLYRTSSKVSYNTLSTELLTITQLLVLKMNQLKGYFLT